MKLGTLRIGKRQAIYRALCSTGCTIQVSVPLLLALLVKIFNSWYREPYPRISVHINLPNTPTKTHLFLSLSSSLWSSIHRLINGQTRNLLAINNLREETFFTPHHHILPFGSNWYLESFSCDCLPTKIFQYGTPREGKSTSYCLSCLFDSCSMWKKK